MQDDDDNDDPMILSNRAKNHTSERTIVPWTVIFYIDFGSILDRFWIYFGWIKECGFSSPCFVFLPHFLLVCVVKAAINRKAIRAFLLQYTYSTKQTDVFHTDSVKTLETAFAWCSI